MQLSGDLGNAGHLLPMLDLTAPHFDVHHHGLQVGSNLIKAAIDTGQLDQARTWLDQHQVMQRPDWRETLSYWESELQKAHLGTHEPVPREKLQCAMLAIEGPLWLPKDHALAAQFPAKPEDAPRIVVMGSSFEAANPGNQVKLTPTDNPGRYSRALPLFFTEHLHMRSPARATTLISWITNGSGGFALSGRAYEDESLVEHARQSTANGPHAADYILYSHLVVRGENTTLQLRLIRCIDGKRLAESQYPFPEAGFHRAAAAVLADLGSMLEKEAEISVASNLPTLEGPGLDHYLLRIEQSLAVNCSTMEDRYAATLSNPSEILSGMLHLCLQNPDHVPSRMILLRTLRKLRKNQPALTSAMRSKVESLFHEYPIAKAQAQLNDELRSIFEETA
jgi:hypothetical protein